MYLKTVSVVGLGYIGLPTAITLAQNGINVTGIDSDEDKVRQINQGISPIHEKGITNQLNKVISSGKFSASTEYVNSDIYIIAVPTPMTAEFKVDLFHLLKSMNALSSLLEGGELIIIESTIPPKTTLELSEYLFKLRPDLKPLDGAEATDNTIHFAHCPERVLSGNALHELVSNDRIIGGLSPKAAEMASELYQVFCKGKLITTDSTTAEMAKLTENAFRDVNIAFANELSIISDNLGISVWELIDLANHHPRVNILQPGPGVGGHCIAIDPWFIVSADPQNSSLIRTARNVNDHKPFWVLDKLNSAIESNEFSKVAFLGIAFKADIDDLRESPAKSIVRDFAIEHPHLEVMVVEPNITHLPHELSILQNVRFVNLNEALQKSNLITLLVDHTEFRELNRETLHGKILLDTKGIWNRLGQNQDSV